MNSRKELVEWALSHPKGPNHIAAIFSRLFNKDRVKAAAYIKGLVPVTARDHILDLAIAEGGCNYYDIQPLFPDYKRQGGVEVQVWHNNRFELWRVGNGKK